jgi:hypothetical protein
VYYEEEKKEEFKQLDRSPVSKKKITNSERTSEVNTPLKKTQSANNSSNKNSQSTGNQKRSS